MNDQQVLQSSVDAPELQFRVLGPLSATLDGVGLNLGGEKQRTVLAMLLARQGAPVSADALIQAVWGDDAADRAGRTLQTYVSALRSVLGGRIERAGSGWRIEVDRGSVDAEMFEATYERARATLDDDPSHTAEALRAALALWTGHAFADTEAHGELDPEIVRLSELRSAALALRIDADLGAGRDADLIGELETLVAQNPYSERFRAQHMLALYRAGRQQEALRSAREIRELLVEELGVDPTNELQQLEQQILEQDPELDAPGHAAVQTRAVLVVDPGDPFELGHLRSADRDDLLDAIAVAVGSSVGDGPIVRHAAGLTTYLVFQNARQAAEVARRAATTSQGGRLCFAIEHGEVVADEHGVSGAPVARAAALAAAAHPGQVVMSAATQQAIAEDGDVGVRFEALGVHSLRGVEHDVTVYQLLVAPDAASFPPLRTDRAVPPLPASHARAVPGYELREAIGDGSVGLLHRAYQPVAGREVLVEVISRIDAATPQFVQSFEADAQRLSLLDHQNISPVLDHWRQPEGAFVVYRLPRGGFLSDALDEGVTVDGPRIVEQIGSALAFANSLGMAHGSVRPDRIGLDEAGNAVLLGFPLAGVEPHASLKHPAYIAPELLVGGTVTETTDVYSLAVLAQELLSAPFEADSLTEVSDPAIARGLSDDPSDRQASVAEFMVELDPMRADSSAARTYTATRNPYKGLSAFGEADASDFFGRGAAIEELTATLAERRLVTVVGPSGVGKSSVVRAGLLPALRSGAIDGSDGWLTTVMVPGSHPFAELQRALESVVVDMPLRLVDALADHQADALSAARTVMPGGREMLVVVDQFEELFTMAGDRERTAFLDLLARASSDGSAKFVLTVRADFVGELLKEGEHAELLRSSIVMLRAPNRAELEDVIVGPARRVGVSVAPDLAQRMISEVSGQPGSLALLQHVLGQMFEVRDTDVLDLGLYDRLGGISGSLARSAEECLDLVEESARPRLQQAFLRLVTIRDELPPTRARIGLASLDDLDVAEALEPFSRRRLLTRDSDPSTHEPTIEVSHEVLLTRWPRLSRWIEDARADLVLSARLNEAVEDWEASGRRDEHLLLGGRLSQHADWTEATSLQLSPAQRELVAASADGERARLDRARSRRRLVVAVLSSIALLATVFGVLAVRAARTASENEQAAVAAEADAVAAQEDAQAAAAVAVAAEADAVAAQEDAQAAAAVARARELAASSVSVADADPELAILLAVEAIDTAPDTALFPEGLISLREAMDANRLLDRLLLPDSTGSALTPDGSGLVVTEAEQRRVSLYAIDNGRFADEPSWSFQDLTTNDLMRGTIIDPTGSYAVLTIGDVPIAADPGPDVVLTDGRDPYPSRLEIIDLATGERIRTVLFDGCDALSIGRGKPWFSTDGSLISLPLDATECAPDPEWVGMALFDTSTWTELARWTFAGLTMTADMSILAVDNFGGPFELLSWPSLEPVRSLDVPSGSGFRGISPDGTIVAVSPRGAEGSRPSFWDAETGLLLGRAENYDGFAGGMEFLPNGLISLASNDSDGVWDPRSGIELIRVSPSSSIDGSITGDGRWKATASPGLGVELWDLSFDAAGSRSLTEGEAGFVWVNPDAVVEGPELAVWGFTTFEDPGLGQRIAILERDGTVVATRDIIEGAAQLPDGRFVHAKLDSDTLEVGPLVVWDPQSGDETVLGACTAGAFEFMAEEPDGSVGPTRGHRCADGELVFQSAGVSHDGSVIVAAAPDPSSFPGPFGSSSTYELRVWDAATLDIISTVTFTGRQQVQQGALGAVGDGWAMFVDTHPGGAPFPSDVVILDTSSGEELLRLSGLWDRGVEELSRDGARLYVAGADELITEIDTTSWTVTKTWPAGVARPRGLALSPSGAALAASGEDGIVVWQIDSDEPVLVDRITTRGWASDIVFLSDDELAAATLDGPFNASWVAYDLDSDAVVAAARAALVREFTADECSTYGIACGS